MKNLLAIVLTAVCVLSFSACDSNKNNSSESSTTTSTTTITTTATTEPPTTTTEKIVIDYNDTESFEAALNAGKNLKNKTVQFVADELHPDSAFGYDIWAGEHLNFVSSQNPDVDAGDTVVAKVTEINSVLGSWIIYYEKLDVTKTDSSAVTTTKKKTTTAKKTTTTKKKTTTTTTTTKQTIYNPSKNPNWGWQGSGDYVATDLKVSNYAVLTATHTGNSNFIVHAYDEDGSRIGLINEIGNYSGQVLIDESGVYEIEIIADGSWNITASGLSITDSTNFSGTGDSVTPIFNTSNRVWEISHTGQSNFIVHEYDVYDDRDGLVNEIGNYSGIVRSDLIGNCFFEILADGSWTIKPAS